MLDGCARVQALRLRVPSRIWMEFFKEEVYEAYEKEEVYTGSV